MAKKVVIGMSGGVDSSVAAYLLLEAGYEVIGVTMKIWDAELTASAPAGKADRTCCSLSAVEDARRVAFKLGIPFYVLNFKEIFTKEVVDYFTESYLQGETPNPCILCNNKLKFQALLEKAQALGADFIATGHYVISGFDPSSGRHTLSRGEDQKKDQSYVLFGLSQQQLAHSLFPLGDLDKGTVRQLARDRRLPTADKGESQEICFIPDHDYGRFLRKRRPEAVQPGEIIDREGKVLGYHEGVSFYTIGQRKGLGIAAEQPLYVVDLLPEDRKVVVGTEKEVYRKEAVLSGVNWVSIPPPLEEIEAEVKIRYAATPAPALVKPQGDGVYIRFHQSQRAITPGQAMVFYHGDLLLGGGFITRNQCR